MRKIERYGWVGGEVLRAADAEWSRPTVTCVTPGGGPDRSPEASPASAIQLGNQFDVVLRGFLRVLATRAPDSGRARWVNFAESAGIRFPGNKTEKNCFDNIQ